jgi:predicted permease
MTRWLYTIPLRLRSLFRRGKVELELEDEVRQHLDRQVEQYIAAGMNPEEARYAALRAFGGVTQHKESARETRRIHWLEDFGKDLRYGVRQLLRTPVLAIAVTLSLALGIGANTAIFTAIDAVILRTLPVRDPGGLVMMTWFAKERPGTLVTDLLGGGFIPDGAPIRGVRAFSRSTFEQVRDRNHVFSSTFAVAGNDQFVNAQTSHGAQAADMQGVSGNYFEALGVPAIAGRTLLAADDRESEPPVGVVSYHFWQDKLGEDASVIGREMVINGNPITIVGVAHPSFSGLAPGSSPDLWVPLSVYMAQQAYSGSNRDQTGNGPPTALPYWSKPTTWWLQVFGRLDPGVTEDRARTELQALFQQGLRDTAGDAAADREMPGLDLTNMKHGLAGLRQQYSTALFLLMGVVGLVLMIACGNVATLLMARATTRQREIAVRLSLGASRRRLVRQLLTESLLLSAIGGALGLVFAIWADNVLVDLLSGPSTLNISLHLDGFVLAFTAVLSLLTGVLFGLLPALRATRLELIGAMRQSGNRNSAETGFRSGKLVVAVQVALCFVLVSSAGLFLRSLGNLHAIDAGFDPQQVLLFVVRPGLNGYKDEKLAAYYQNLTQRIGSIPGVRSVGLSTRSPVGGGVGRSGVIIPGYTPAGQTIDVNRHQVGAGYFETLGIPIVRGRGVGPEDQRGAPNVVVVNEKFVKQFFHGDDPIGRRLRLGSRPDNPTFEIVGVARDVKYNRLQDDVPPTTYYSYLQFLSIPNAMMFEVRGARDVASLIAPIEREGGLLDPGVPVTDVRTEVQVIEQTFVLERTFAALSAAFGALALLLVTVGLYGTIAYTVTRQTKEIGIRMALGARREAILVAVMKRTVVILLGGLGGGLILTLAATPLLKSYLFGLVPRDLQTIAICAAVIATITLAAGFLPARRASRIDPMISLREE